jgi:hypothetical protein
LYWRPVFVLIFNWVGKGRLGWGVGLCIRRGSTSDAGQPLDQQLRKENIIIDLLTNKIMIEVSKNKLSSS